ncbi:MAG: translation initiation factor IF-2, partial [Microthrixaceae bacterium]
NTSRNERNVLAKLRVYELAKELGLTNKECIELCNALGYGVKSHSSSLDGAYADQVRRKAKREGLIRDQQPEDEKTKKKASAASAEGSKSSKSTTKAAEPNPKTGESKTGESKTAESKTAESGAQKSEPAAESAPAPAAPAQPAATTPPQPAATTPAESSEEPATAKEATPEDQTRSAAAAPTAPGAEPAAKKVISSKPTSGRPAVKPAEPSSAPQTAAARPTAPPAPGRPRPPAAPPVQAPAASGSPTSAEPAAARTSDQGERVPAGSAPEARTATPDSSADAAATEAKGASTAPQAAPPGTAEDKAAPPLSPSGKPIPPPPGPPLSRTGKPIPPPPGLGGRGPAPSGRGPGGPGRGATSAPGRSGARPGGPGGFSRPPAGPGGFPPPGGGPGGGPGGRPGGGRPGGPQRPPRRKGRRRRNREELQPMDIPTYTPASAPVPDGTVVIERGSTPQDLGPKLNRTAADVVRFLLQQGEMVTATQSLPDEMIELFAEEVGAVISLVDLGQEQEVELRKVLEIPDDEDADTEDWAHRAPVITVMGHVDHGKTKLLDRIRNADVAAGESGGITQRIGAYKVVRDGKSLTFIDTPGHEAFTAMRVRGAEATDIVVLVVAADDGVMPQTVEAIQHAKAAEVPIVVAINKIDREAADPTRVMQQLSENGLVPEAWGGDTVMAEVSALQGIGIDELLETLLLVAEVEDLRASPEGRARGVVIEAHLDIGRGPVASVLVQHGTLRVGDPLVAGPAWGRIRALINDKGEQIKEAGPSTPVEVLGLSDVAYAGDDFIVAPDERKARSVAETRERWHRDVERGRDSSVNVQGARLEDIFAQIEAGEQATLNLIIKADARGTLEALTESLKELERPEVKIGFVLRGVGAISESDIALAATSEATIFGFNVRPSRQARDLAAADGVEIRTYEVIYKLLDDVRDAMLGMLEPEYEEVVTGDAEVREIFRVPKIGAIAGCLVQSGVITRNSKVRFIRDGTILWNGEVSSLRRFKDDVREVAAGYECGIGLSDFQDLKPGDIIETYELRELPRV